MRLRDKVAIITGAGSGIGKASAEFTPTKSFEGYKNILHGGILSTLLDEVMIKSIIAKEILTVTSQIEVKFKRPAIIGEKLIVEIHKPNGDQLTIEPIVFEILPEKELTWGGGIKGLFFGEHVFLIEETETGSTKLIQKEVFEGIFVPFASLEAVDEGYRLMNQALKKRAEAIEGKQ